MENLQLLYCKLCLGPLNIEIFFFYKYFNNLLSWFALCPGIAVLQSTESEDLFKGSHWNHPGETIEAQELLTAKYVRVESHTIRTSGGEVVSGWLWVDFHDRVRLHC